VFSPDSQHVAYATQGTDKTWFVVQDGQEGKPYWAWVDGPVFSPDSQRLAYAVAMGEDKQAVVVDNRVSKTYRDIKVGTLTFSPDSRWLAYGARAEKTWTVVINGQEGKPYENLISLGGGQIVFDAPERLQYLVTRGQDIYVVQEQLK
jgi:hypothetical protein